VAAGSIVIEAALTANAGVWANNVGAIAIVAMMTSRCTFE
jgi:hypothetical protein